MSWTMYLPMLGSSLNECLLIQRPYPSTMRNRTESVMAGSAVPAITRGQDEIPPPGMLAYQQRSVRRVGTPAHGLVEQRPTRKARQERLHRPLDRPL
jgi:hypothetical protein